MDELATSKQESQELTPKAVYGTPALLTGFDADHSRWAIARMFPSVSLNQAVLPRRPCTKLFFIFRLGMAYSSNFTPRAFSSATSASTSLTCQKAWLALDEPALGVGYINTSAPPRKGLPRGRQHHLLIASPWPDENESKKKSS